MALFKHIKTPADLPPVGTSYEREHLDFKERVFGGGTYEQAKDVAAFANRTGGAIIVGAKDENDRLDRYVPMSLPDAEATSKRFNDAVKDRCFPQPKVEVEIIPRESGYVVGVNVWPLPAQIVGVKVPVAKAPGDKISEWAFVVPVRVQAGTDFLEPQEFAKVMVSQLRRMAIALEEIPPNERENLFVHWAAPRGDGGAEPMAILRDVDIHTCRVRLDVMFGHRHLPVELPLEAVLSVQPMPSRPLLQGRIWRVCLSGQLTLIAETVQWDPPRA